MSPKNQPLTSPSHIAMAPRFVFGLPHRDPGPQSLSEPHLYAVGFALRQLSWHIAEAVLSCVFQLRYLQRAQPRKLFVVFFVA
jgi:hypothetical protein